LQRILNNSSEIETTSEPWFLLHYLGINKNLSLSKFSFSAIQKGLSSSLDRKSYLELLKTHILDLYDEMSKTKRNREFLYFLDKTPRYYWILNEIHELFPDAKYIYLTRNPINVFSSTMTSWGNNTLKNYFYCYEDLNIAYKKISESFKINHENNNVLHIKYEDLITDTNKTIKQISKFLLLKYKISSDIKSQIIDGPFGDNTGIKKYDSISTLPLFSYKKFVNTIFRKWFLMNYLKNFDNDFFKLFDYDRSTILQSLKELSLKKLIRIDDIYFLIKTKLVLKYKLNLIFGKSYVKDFESSYFS